MPNIKPKYGQAQAEFIVKVRNAVKNDANFFHNRDWKKIEPTGGRRSSFTSNKKLFADSFYVRPLAVWLPHLLFPGHVPACSKCGSAKYVDLSQCRWIESPIILFGRSDHRYLDTMYYYCSHCRKRFQGFNKQSLQADASKYVGYFNFYLGCKGYAVDEELHSYIINTAPTQSTATIADQLNRSIVDNYFSAYQNYLHAVESEKIKKQKPNVATTDRRQPTIDSIFQRGVSTTPNERRIRMLKEELVTLKRDLSTAQKVCEEGDISFDSVKRLKGSKNAINPPLKGIGISKLDLLIKYGITTAKQLVRWNGNRHAATLDLEKRRRWYNTLYRWKAIAQQDLAVRKREVDRLQKQVELKENDILLEQVIMDAEADPLGENSSHEGDPPNEQERCAIEPEPDSIPIFSRIDDPLGYNARFISKHRIDSIVEHEFGIRKELQENKMKSLKATMLKIDFNYKLAAKIRVWTGPGKSFSPYRCLITIQNEDGLTVFWKALKHSESFTEIEGDLIRLRDRLNRNKGFTPVLNPQAVKVIYVDNCCSVVRKLTSIFGDVVQTKLDAFHWLQRWNDAISEPASAVAGVFRTMMSRAIFMVEDSEYERAKQRLIDRKVQNPTKKQVMKEAKAIIPNPTILRSNIEAVLSFVYQKDSETERKLATRAVDDTSPVPKRFLKSSNSTVRDVVRRQFVHVDNGCLSDPIDYNIFRVNKKTGRIFSCRGTNTNERDNLDLSRILVATHIGIHRAERLMYGYFEQSNERKRIRRLGGDDLGTYATEKLAAINSRARTIGIWGEDIPYGSAHMPTISKDSVKEYIGFEYKPSSLSDGGDGDEDMPTESDIEMAGFLSGVDFESDDDIPVSIDLTEADMIAIPDPNMDQERVAELANESDLSHQSAIQSEINKLLPITFGRESTLQAFKRLTQKNEWLPFRDPLGDSNKTLLDVEEARVFDEFMKSGNYDGDAAPSSNKGFHKLESDWNTEVAVRFRAWTNGVLDSNKLINRKKTEQLIDHFKRVRQIAQLALLTDRDDPLRRFMDSVRRMNRQQLTPMPQPLAFQPITYANPGRIPMGRPLTLNSEIFAGAIQQTGTATTNAPWTFRPQPQVPAQPFVDPLRGFRTKMYCKTCGFKNRDHAAIEGEPSKSCTRNWCGRCHQLKRYHDEAGCRMGPHCKLPIHRNSDYKNWYRKRKVSYWICYCAYCCWCTHAPIQQCIN